MQGVQVKLWDPLRMCAILERLRGVFTTRCYTNPRLPYLTLHSRNRNFQLFAPVTLTLTRWPSYTNLTCISWRYTWCTGMNFLHQGFQKLSSDRHTYRQTGTSEIIYHAASRVVNSIDAYAYAYRNAISLSGNCNSMVICIYLFIYLNIQWQWLSETVCACVYKLSSRSTLHIYTKSCIVSEWLRVFFKIFL